MGRDPAGAWYQVLEEQKVTGSWGGSNPFDVQNSRQSCATKTAMKVAFHGLMQKMHEKEIIQPGSRSSAGST
jgi:hypothetical protein